MAQHDVIDPRLGSASLSALSRPPQYGDLPAPPPPPPFTHGSRSDAPSAEIAPPYRDAQQSPAHPYYYPTPQGHTPLSSALGGHSGPASNASPNDQYAAPMSPENGDGPGNPDDPKRPRACEACRGLKVRCDQDPEHLEVPCRRCARAGRPCVITQPSRKRQKKADSRVAELEKKLDALTAVLQQRHQGTPSTSSPGQAIHGARRPESLLKPTGATVPPYQPTGASVSPYQHTSASVSPYQHTGAYPLEGAQPGLAASYAAKVSSAIPAVSHKRRRIDDEVVSTPDVGDVFARSHLSRTASHADLYKDSKEYDAHFDHSAVHWNPTQDLKKDLYATNPDFEERINSLVSPAMATSIFTRYVNDLSCHLPAVVFPAGTTAKQLLEEKPVLYLCILSTASFGILRPDITRQLSREALSVIAGCVVNSGAKSLELIQGMQAIALWYKPPEQAEPTNFYQIIHMAAVMALDIGLGKRFNASKARSGFGGATADYASGPGKNLPQDSDTIEARRAWLGCYYLCASASMVLRRPNLIRWTNYMMECIEVLETSPDAAPTDRFFAQHVKIQHICEEIGLQFLMDDSSATISISDPKVTYALSVLEQQLKTWNEQIPADVRTPGLEFFYHVTSLYLHEIALHFNHNVDDFRLPFTEESLKSVNNTADTLTQSQMTALEACLKAAHGILDTMLGFSPEVTKTLPMLLYFVRCIYSIVILIKMHLSISAPGSEVGKIMKAEDLRVEHYIDSLSDMFSYVTKKEEFCPHPRMLRMLGVLKQWFRRHKDGIAKQPPGEQASALPQPVQKHNYKPANNVSKSSAAQTPLHLLSQVATGSNANTPHLAPDAAQDWTFSTPRPIDYSRALSATSLAQANAHSTAVAAAAEPYPDSTAIPSQDYGWGWGSGFEQAMDIALGPIDGLQGGGLDTWFLGDGMAPFQFQVDAGTGGMDT